MSELIPHTVVSSLKEEGESVELVLTNGVKLITKKTNFENYDNFKTEVLNSNRPVSL